MAEAFQAPRKIEQQFADEEQRRLADRLRSIQYSTQLGNTAKAQQTRDAVRDFIVRNPAQVTSESVKTFVVQLNAVKSGLQTAVREFDRELERNYNHYWSPEQTKDAFAARAELRKRTDAMLRSLEQVSYSLQQFVNIKEGKAGSAEVAAGIEKLLGGEVKPTSADEWLARGLQNLGNYSRACRSVNQQINQISLMGRNIGEDVEAGKARTETIGAVIASTEIAVAGMFVASVLAVGVVGAAAIGGTANLAASAVMTGITEKRWLKPAEAAKSFALGAALGALGHIGHARHIRHLEKGADFVDSSISVSESADAMASAGRVGIAAVRAEAIAARAAPLVRATARSTEMTEHAYHAMAHERHAADKRVADSE